MCTEMSANEYHVCDVALPDVKAALQSIGSVEFVHRPYEATIVSNADPAVTGTFKLLVQEAIAKQT